MSIQYYYKEFAYNLSPQSTWCRIASGNTSGYSEAGARVEFWNNFQRGILSELQKEFDMGWEPISEVGPAGMSIQTSRELFTDVSGFGVIMGIVIYIMVGIGTFGIGFFVFPFFMMSWIARPVAFRVNLRKRR
jgi:hypothetical protein